MTAEWSILNLFILFRYLACTEYEPDELNPSLYSFHSNIDEKNKLLYTFSQQGIETVVDRAAKKNRIKDWIQSSIITEEDEEVRYNATAFLL
jgi:hypothetical protein